MANKKTISGNIGLVYLDEMDAVFIECRNINLWQIHALLKSGTSVCIHEENNMEAIKSRLDMYCKVIESYELD